MYKAYTLAKPRLEELDDVATDLEVNVINVIADTVYAFENNSAVSTVYLDVPAMLAGLERLADVLRSLTPNTLR